MAAGNRRRRSNKVAAMGFRIRKSVKVLPGVRLNLSQSGVSASVGQPGATVNIGGKGARATVGIPGTGISYSQSISTPAHAPAQPSESDGSWLLWAMAALAMGMLVYGVLWCAAAGL
jgi:hypothetical protein